MSCTRRFGCSCAECLAFALPPPSSSAAAFSSSFRDDIPFSSSVTSAVDAVCEGEVQNEEKNNFSNNDENAARLVTSTKVYVTKVVDAVEDTPIQTMNDPIVGGQLTEQKDAAGKGRNVKGKPQAQKKTVVATTKSSSQSLPSTSSSLSESINETSTADGFSNVLPTLTLYAGEDAPLPGAGRGTYKFSNSEAPESTTSMISDSFKDSFVIDSNEIVPKTMSSASSSSSSDALDKQSGGLSMAVDPHASIPLADRLVSKNSSLKRSAVTELTEATKRYVALPMLRAPTDDQKSVFFSSSPAAIGSLLSSLISDGNALVSEAGVALVAAMCSFFLPGSRAPPLQTPQSLVLGLLKGSGKELVQKISSKAFSASRSLLIDAAVNTVSSLMALEGIECGLLDMLEGLRMMPKPKVIKCCSRVLVSLCEAGLLQPSALPKGCLGPGVRPDASAFTTQLPTLLLSADKMIFSAGIELSKAFLKIFPRDVEKMCVEYGKKAGGFSPELVASILSAGGVSRNSEGGEEGSGVADKTAIKPKVLAPLWDRLDAAYALLSPSEAVDISKAVEACKLEAAFNGGKSGAPKWGDKVKAINSLIAAIEGTTSSSSDDLESSPAEGNPSPLGHVRVAGDSHTFSGEVAILRKGIKDSNANVAARSMQALASFASRMRGSFSLSAKQSLGDVVSRLKEKSRATVAASSTCIKAFVRWDCVSVEDVISEVLPLEGAFASSQSPVENESWRKASPELKTNLCAVVCATLITPVSSPPHFFSTSASGATGTGTIVLTRIRCLARFGEAAALDANADVRAHGEKLLAKISLRISLASKKGEADTALTSNADLAKALSSLPVPARDRVVAYAKTVETDPPAELPSTSTTITAPVSESNDLRPPAPVVNVSAPITAAAKKSTKKATGLLSTSIVARTAALPSSSSSSVSAQGGAADAWYENTIAEEQGFPNLSGDEALESLLALPLPSFDETQSRGLGSQQWKEKRDSISAFGAAVCSLPGNGASKHADAAISVLAHKTGGFKGLNNPNVLVACASAIEAIAHACTSSSNILRRTARVVLDGLIPYTKERKGSEEIGSMAYALARVVGPNFVASRLYALSSEEKATPGVRTAANERIGALISGFGVGRLAAGPAMRHLAGPYGIQCASLPVKTAAIRSLCHLHRQLGPPLLDSLRAAKNKFNLGDMLIKTVIAEFEKAWTPGTSYSVSDTGGGAYDVARARALIDATSPSLLESTPPIVTLHGEVFCSGSVAANEIGIGSFASSISSSASALLGDAAAGKIGSSGGTNSLSITQALVDVMSLLPRSILDDLEFESAKAEDAKKPKGGKSEDMKPWQVRMKAVETVQAALSQASALTSGAPCVSPSESVLALARSLKKTLADSQANTRPKACAAVTELARAVGSPGMLRCGALKLLAPCLLDQLGDKKAGLREAVLVSLDSLVAEPNADATQSGGAAAVSSPSFCAVVEAAMKGSAMATNVGGARDDVLCWIARHSAAIAPSPNAINLFQQLASKAVEALGDRSPAARAAASDLVAHVVRIAGVDSVKGALDMLKPAQRLAVEGSLETAVASGKALLAQTIASRTMAQPSLAAGQLGVTDLNEAIAPLASSAIGGGKALNKKTGTTTVKNGSASASASTVASSSESYALFMGQSAAKEARMSKSAAESSAVRFNLRLGSDGGASDAMLQQKQILRLTQNDWTAAKCASASLMACLFADGDSSSEKHVEAMKWITQQLMLDCTAVVPAASSPTLDFVRNNSDLLFKYIAAQLWEPRGKPAALTVSQTLLDRILSLFSQRGWALAWLEGEVLLPALCERTGSGIGSSSSSSVDDKASGLIVNTILLLRTCVEYAPRGSSGVDSPLAHILERHIYSRILDSKAKQSMRVSLCSVAARLMRAVSSSGATHSVTLRRSIVVQIVRLCERDGMQSRDSPLQSVEVRSGLGELLSELFAQLGGGGAQPSSPAVWSSFWKLATIDAKAATSLGLPVGVTLEVEARLKADIEKKWMPSWMSKRNKDLENEARFISPGLLSTRPTTISTTTLLPCDDEIAAALNEPPSESTAINDALPLSPQHLTAGIRRSSIEKALMAAVEDEANAAAVAAALSAGEKAVAAIVPPQFPRSGVVWRSNSALSSSSSSQQLPASPARPITRSGLAGNGKTTMIPSPAPSAIKRLRAATGVDMPVSCSSIGSSTVLLLSAGPVPQFPTIPAGVLPSCPVDVCSGLVNLRSACKRVGDVLGMMSNSGQSNQQQQQQHASSIAFSTALAPAMSDAAASLESLESSIRGACKSSLGAPLNISPSISAKALCENAAVIVDSLALAWRILPSSPTVLGAGASSPRSRGAHVAAAVRAMATLPLLTTLLLAQVPDFAKCITESSAHSLLSAIEYTHARQAHAHARSVHEGVGRALMAAVYHLKRVTVATWFLFAMKTTAAWSPESPVDPAPLPFNSRRTRNLRSLMRRLCSYEFRLEQRETTSRKEKWVSSQSGSVNASDTPHEDIVLLARAFADVFDDKVISPRAFAVVFASDHSHLQVGPNGEIPVAFSSRATLGCECDADVCASIISAITNVRDLFAGVVGQTGLMFSPALAAVGLPASSASPQGPSVLRRLYHTFLSAMAAQQGVTQLCDVKAWEFDLQGAEAALARSTLSNINLNSTTSSVASLDAAAMSVIPSTPAFNRTGSALGATTSASITSPTSAFTMELVGSVTNVVVAASAILPFNDAAEAASMKKMTGLKESSRGAEPSSAPSTSRKQPASLVLPFSSPTLNTLPGMSYDEMALAAATPMPHSKNISRVAAENLNLSVAPATASKLRRPATGAAAGPITTPAALRKAPASIIVPLGIAIAAQGEKEANGQSLSRQLDLVSEEDVPRSDVNPSQTSTSTNTAAAPRLPISSAPPIAPVLGGPLSTTPTAVLPSADDCRAAAGLLHPSLSTELSAALGPCLLAANTLSSSTTAPSPPPPWKTHAVPLIAALVSRATLPGASFGLSSLPFKGTGRDAVVTDPITAALYVSVCDAGVSLTSQKVLFSNLNLFALKNGAAPGGNPDAISLGKTPLFVFAKYVTALSTTSTATTMSSTSAVSLPVRPALGTTTTHSNVPLTATSKTRPQVI